MLAAAVFARPDLLLLDEPTNHLSIGAVMWLARELSTSPVRDMQTLTTRIHTYAHIHADMHQAISFLFFSCTHVRLPNNSQIVRDSSDVLFAGVTSSFRKFVDCPFDMGIY